MTFDELYRQAQSVLNPRQLSESERRRRECGAADPYAATSTWACASTRLVRWAFAQNTPRRPR